MNTECLPRLHEVRLFSENGLEQLGVTLDKNKTIALVEVCGLESRYVGVSKNFDSKHNGVEVEMTTLLLAHKLAFISVLTNEASRVVRASSNTMEQWIFKRIFELTELPVQRQILWKVD